MILLVFVHSPLLIVSGNEYLLRCDSDPETGFWGKLLDFYQKRNCIVDAKLFPARPDEQQFRHQKRNQALQVAEKEAKNLEFEDRFKELPPRLQKQYLAQEKMFQ